MRDDELWLSPQSVFVFLHFLAAGPAQGRQGYPKLKISFASLLQGDFLFFPFFHSGGVDNAWWVDGAEQLHRKHNYRGGSVGDMNYSYSLVTYAAIIIVSYAVGTMVNRLDMLALATQDLDDPSWRQK